uniref:Uncharacterized protein n=1 Tax=Aegilops tauschii TaxID=37682 RepID=R7W1U3_AEGTA
MKGKGQAPVTKYLGGGAQRRAQISFLLDPLLHHGGVSEQLPDCDDVLLAELPHEIEKYRWLRISGFACLTMTSLPSKAESSFQDRAARRINIYPVLRIAEIDMPMSTGKSA